MPTGKTLPGTRYALNPLSQAPSQPTWPAAPADPPSPITILTVFSSDKEQQGSSSLQQRAHAVFFLPGAHGRTAGFRPLLKCLLLTTSFTPSSSYTDLYVKLFPALGLCLFFYLPEMLPLICAQPKYCLHHSLLARVKCYTCSSPHSRQR